MVWPGAHGMVYGMAWLSSDGLWCGLAGMAHGMVFGMALWARQDIWYGLVAMAWYMLWPGGHHMYTVWRTSYGIWYSLARYVVIC